MKPTADGKKLLSLYELIYGDCPQKKNNHIGCLCSTKLRPIFAFILAVMVMYYKELGGVTLQVFTQSGVQFLCETNPYPNIHGGEGVPTSTSVIVCMSTGLCGLRVFVM